jgi:hypothetical protein
VRCIFRPTGLPRRALHFSTGVHTPARGLPTKPRSAQGRTSSIARNSANARGRVVGCPVLHACRDRRAMIAAIISAPLRSIAVRLTWRSVVEPSSPFPWLVAVRPSLRSQATG